MSFAAVNFLKREIEDLLTSHGNSLAAPSREILQFAIKEMDSLQQITKRFIPWSRADTTFKYEVSRIHGEFGGFLGGIKLIDCDPSCAEQMKKATQDWKVDVHSSWDDKK
ncbi:hypothetical protein SASPL_126053 [Salvia splendens]|uniref:Uncharacterized protein n=1 Tax=Salvia splendens TaxID=180675 RepID=A0A8X8XI70_SALSN|nr:hypothetical protein SASPL_126053 [Salvia splendens]